MLLNRAQQAVVVRRLRLRLVVAALFFFAAVLAAVGEQVVGRVFRPCRPTSSSSGLRGIRLTSPKFSASVSLLACSGVSSSETVLAIVRSSPPSGERCTVWSTANTRMFCRMTFDLGRCRCRCARRCLTNSCTSTRSPGLNKPAALFSASTAIVFSRKPFGIDVIGSAIWPGREQLAFEDRLAFDDRGPRPAAFQVFELRDRAGRNLVLGPLLQRHHGGVDRVAQVDVVQRDVDRHGFELAPGCLALRSMTWLMPIEATRPQPNAKRQQQQRFRSHDISLGSARRTSALELPHRVGETDYAASMVANGTLSVSSARSTNPVQANRRAGKVAAA